MRLVGGSLGLPPPSALGKGFSLKTRIPYLALAATGCLLSLAASPAGAGTVRFFENTLHETHTLNEIFLDPNATFGDLDRNLVPRKSFTLNTVGYNSVQGQVTNFILSPDGDGG